MMKAKNVIASLAILSIILILIFILINRLRKKESFEEELERPSLTDAQQAYDDAMKEWVAAEEAAAGPTFGLEDYNQKMGEAARLRVVALEARDALDKEAVSVQFDGKEVAATKAAAKEMSAKKLSSEEDATDSQINCSGRKEGMDACCKKFVNSQPNFTNAHLNESTGICTLNNIECTIKVTFYDILITGDNTLNNVVNQMKDLALSDQMQRDEKSNKQRDEKSNKFERPDTLEEFKAFYQKLINKETEAFTNASKKRGGYNKTSRIILTKNDVDNHPEFDPTVHVGTHPFNSELDDDFDNILSLSLNGEEVDEINNNGDHLTLTDATATEYFNKFKQNSDTTEFYFYHFYFTRLAPTS